MKTYAWYLALGAVGLGMMGAGAACTVTTVNNGGDDSGASATPNEAGSGSEAASSSDAGTTPDTGVAAEASTCTLPVMSGVPACDTCLQQNCCQQAVACDTPDDAGVDDAGLSMCEKLIGCVSDCVNPPADSGVEGGSTATCFGTCGASYSATEMTNATSLVSCTTASCASMCQ